MYRFNNSTTNWDQIASAAAAPMCFDYGPEPAPRSYFVTATNAEGESAASEIVTAEEGEAFPVLHRSPSEFPEPDQRYGWVMPTSARIIWYLQQTSGAEGMLEFGPLGANMEMVYFQTNYQMFGHGVTLTNLLPFTH